MDDKGGTATKGQEANGLGKQAAQARQCIGIDLNQP
jgi:hypothetical protein